MSIPLDRLYHYIESVAQEVYGDSIIYRFYPHGSKKLKDLSALKIQSDSYFFPEIYCNDQEPLNFDLYNNPTWQDHNAWAPREHKDYIDPFPFYNNLRIQFDHIYDHCVLLHSEKQSEDLARYIQNGFIPAYYWSHALIALDWYRFAQHINKNLNSTNIHFLIYNRAWAGTREYRLKFADLLIENNLNVLCNIKFSAIDPELNIHYNEYSYTNPTFKPNCVIENFLPLNTYSSDASADFNIIDYTNSNIEIVLETLFDDQRIHLTEKILRPIACGHPFILCATAGSLRYLREYGFKTFGEIINESYDSEKDPIKRLNLIIDVMKEIANWSTEQKYCNLRKMQNIADYNKEYFFSKEFLNLITSELKTNLQHALTQVDNLNTGNRYLTLWKYLKSYPGISQIVSQIIPRSQLAKMVKKARAARKLNK